MLQLAYSSQQVSEACKPQHHVYRMDPVMDVMDSSQLNELGQRSRRCWIPRRPQHGVNTPTSLEYSHKVLAGLQGKTGRLRCVTSLNSIHSLIPVVFTHCPGRSAR